MTAPTLAYRIGDCVDVLKEFPENEAIIKGRLSSIPPPIEGFS